MRILVVAHAFPPRTQGGAEIYADQHAQTLVRLFGDEVHVLAREQRPDRDEYAVTTEQRPVATGGLTITWVNNTFRDVRTYEDSYRSPAIARIAAGLIDEFRPFLTTEPRARRARFWWDVLAEALASNRPAHDEWYARFKASPPAVRDEMLLQLAQKSSVPLTSDDAGPMLEDEVRRLREFPLIEIGAHTVHHPSLPALSPEDCHREVSESRSALERLTGQRVTSFAYPFGAMSSEAVDAVAAAGFEIAVTLGNRALRAREHHLRIPRLAIREESGADFAARLEGR